MEQNFNSIAAQKAKIAHKYFTSNAFKQQLAFAVKEQIVGDGRSAANFSPELSYAFSGLGTSIDSKRDMPDLQAAFAKVKAENPGLNHIRVEGPYVVIDTKRNTFIRRHSGRAFRG